MREAASEKGIVEEYVCFVVAASEKRHVCHLSLRKTTDDALTQTDVGSEVQTRAPFGVMDTHRFGTFIDLLIFF